MLTHSEPDLSWLSEPARFQADTIVMGDIATAYHPWITLSGSMTAAIASNFQQAPSVKLHYSGSSPLLDWETTLLNAGVAAETSRPTASKTQAFARQITLLINKDEVLAARSVTCCPVIQQELTELRQLPLATRLFESPDWQRLGEPQVLQGTDQGLTGRVCCWQFQPSGNMLLVEEFMLAPLLQKSAQQPI